MRLLSTITKKIRLFLKSRRLSRFRRSPKIFVPTPSRFLVVIPFKGISVVLIIFLVLAASYLFIRSDLFLVKDLQITRLKAWQQGDFVSTQDVKNTLLPLLAQSILTISAQEVETRLQDEFLAIDTVQVKKELPDHLAVTYSERIPVAVIRVKKTSVAAEIKQGEQGQVLKKAQKMVVTQSFLVDKNGLIFAKKERAADLPELDLAGVEEQDLRVGSSISSWQVTAATAVIKTDLDLGRVKLLRLVLQQKGYLEAYYSGDLVVLFDSKGKNIDSQISSLQSLYHQAKIESRKLSRVDLRFARPVVS